MNKIKGLIVLAMALWGLDAQAETTWFQVYTDETLSYYINPDSARKVGSRVKFSDLVDYKQSRVTDGLDPYLSMQTESEFDCEQEASRWLYASFHRGNMASGAVIQLASNAQPEEQWVNVEPGSLGELRWTFACVQLHW